MDYKTLYSADVVVAGGGLAGVSAAIAAAREGLSVCLIEASGVVGGAATNGLVAPISSLNGNISNVKFGGIGQEFVDLNIEKAKEFCKATEAPANSLHTTKYVLLEMLYQAGVKILFHTFIVDAILNDDDSLNSVLVATKAGIQKVEGKLFIDCTGDGDLAYRTKATMVYGNGDGELSSVVNAGNKDDVDGDYKGQVQPCSIMFTMGGVDIEEGKKLMNRTITYDMLGITKEDFLKWEYANTLGFEVDDSNIVPMPQGRVWLCKSLRKNEAVINMSRVIGVNPTDPLCYADAEVKAGRQVLAIVSYLQHFVPGFENSYLMDSACSLGIRESRRLSGEYMLTGNDAIDCVTFDDTIAHGSYIIDIHDPTGKRKALGGNIKGDFYSIPYRSLITKKCKNLSVAGRLISADHVAMSSTRIQGTCMLTGQACGTAAAFAIKNGNSFVDVDVKALQNRLVENDVFIYGVSK